MFEPVDLNHLPLDLNGLIAALAEMNEQSTRAGQAATLERHLVSAELNPDPMALLDLENALEMLRDALQTERHWRESNLDLSKFYAA
jgi:hypothetical protein